MGGAAVGLA